MRIPAWPRPLDYRNPTCPSDPATSDHGPSSPFCALSHPPAYRTPASTHPDYRTLWSSSARPTIATSGKRRKETGCNEESAPSGESS